MKKCFSYFALLKALLKNYLDLNSSSYRWESEMSWRKNSIFKTLLNHHFMTCPYKCRTYLNDPFKFYINLCDQ